MRRRSGFTLVEVLVSMALILFIMSILAAAFAAATQTVSDLKSAGDLAEKLRGAVNVLRRDLEQDHFTDSAAAISRLSQVFNGAPKSEPPPPSVGFFRIYEGQPDQQEGGATMVDLDNIPSFYQFTTALHYTVALHGSKRSDFLSAFINPTGMVGTSPLLNPADAILGPPDWRYEDTPSTTAPQVYNSQLAEIAVFLAATGDTTDNGTPLFALYRRQFLAVPTGWPPPPPPPPPTAPASQALNYLEMSAVPNGGEPSAATNMTFNQMGDLTMPVRRFWMDRSGANGANQPAGLFPIAPSAQQPYGRYATVGDVLPANAASDLLMTDVVSFDVRVLLLGDSEFRDLYDPVVQTFASNNPAFTGNGPRVFDTWSSKVDPISGADYSKWDGPWRTPALPVNAATIPLYRNAAGQYISIQAIQITLRVWDFKTKKTRQVTMVQQM